MLSIQGCRNCLKRHWSLVEVEAIRKIAGVSGCISVGRRSSRRNITHTEGSLDEFQNAPEIVYLVGNVGWLRVRRDHDQGHAETIFIGVDDAWTTCDGGTHVVVPASPIIPGNDDGRVRPVLAVANGVHH